MFPHFGILLLVFYFNLSVNAGLILFNASTNETLLDSPLAYTPQFGSIENFSPILNRPTLMLGDLCVNNFVLNQSLFVNSPIVFYTQLDCDESVPLSKLAPFAHLISGCVELYGSREAVVLLQDLDADPNDSPPRFAFNPPRNTLVYMRVHGSAAGLAARLMNQTTTTMTCSLTYKHDPWVENYFTPAYIIYYSVVFLFFCVYVLQHSIRSLVMIQRVKQKRMQTQRGVDLQIVTMGIALLLSLVRWVEYTCSILRDYFDVWTPELVTQLSWGYGYVILLCTMLLLVLFWADVLKSSKVKLTFIEGFSIKLFFVFFVVVWVGLTIFVVLFVYQLPGTEYAKGAGFLLLGLVAFIESVSVLIFGGRLLRQLTDIKPMAERGSKLVVSSENPQFSSSPTAANSRLSVLGGSTTTLMMQQINNSMSEEDKRNLKEARKRAKPLTRLVVVSATMLFTATVLSISATFSYVLSSPDTYLVVFALLASIEILIYSLVLHAMSPIWQERRRRRNGDNESFMEIHEEEGKQNKCCFRLRKLWREWFVGM